MGITNNLPPQAYTRDVLAQAYNWLKTQPAQIKERATTADSLVSLYLQARRSGAAGATNPSSSWSSEAPASSEAFKNDLKNLAQGLKAFDQTNESATTGPAPMIDPPPPEEESVFSPTQAANQSPLIMVSPMLNLDPKSLNMVKEIQNKLNLSTEAEALRALIALGYERLKPILNS